MKDLVLAQKVFHTLNPPKHEEVAIFRRKISGFRMFAELRELRSNGAIRGRQQWWDMNIWEHFGG
jgi:hypothetical protein